MIGGNWWGSVLWSGAPVGTYQSYAHSISRMPITLVQLDIDICGRSFGVAPCDGTGAACYNTYTTCKNKASYLKTIKILEFVTIDTGTPFKQGERPYLLSVDYLPTEIKDSLTVSGRLKIKIADEPDTDYGIDPYMSTRTLPKPGTYWKKFLARNPNYQGRTVRVWEGWQGLSRSGFQLRWQGTLDNITYDKDQVILDCVDPIKSIADYKLPHKIEVSIAGDITAGTTELAARLSSRLSTYSYFRISDEVMQVNSYNSAIDSVYVSRAALNTEAEALRAGAKMQPIWHRGPENPFDTMLFISSFCDMSASLDATAFAAAKDWPGDDKDIETYINEPVNCDKLLFELADLTNTRIWYDEHQRITCKRISANDPNRTYINISDHANIIEDSASVNYRALERISRYWMYWGLSPIGEEDKSTSYSYLTGAIDADAESSLCYDKIIEETIYNRWSHSAEGPGHTDAVMRAKTYVQRMLFNRRDPLPMINLKVELKDSTIMTGDYVRIDTDEIEEITGVHTFNKYIVTYRDVIGEGVISLKAQALPMRNIAIIAPATLTADWSAASTDDRVYAYICDSSGVMSDGETAGYHIY